MSFQSFSQPSSTRNQYLAAFAVNLISLSHGCAIGFVSPFLPYLRSHDSHLNTGPVSSENVSWIGSLLAVGGCFGAIIYGKISQKFGQKVTLIALVFPHLLFWCLALASTEVHHLYIARILAGFTGGGTIRTIPLYISEISENNIRGKLGTYLMLFLSTGTLIIFVAGTYLSFFKVPLVMLVFPLMYLILVSFLPDTPPSLMSRNKADKAWDSLLFYRTCGKNKVVSESFKEEFEMLKLKLENKGCEKLEMKDFLTKPAKKGLIIGLFLVFLNQYSGTLVIMTYTADIFKSSGSNLSPNESSQIVALIQLTGVYVSTICVEKFGRKTLLTISSIGSAFFFIVLATYLYLKESGVDLSNLGWIPIISLSLVIFIASLGIIPLPFVVTTELLPNNIRGVAVTVCMSAITFFAFTILKIFPLMVLRLELYGCLIFFAGICAAGALITIFFIPETKGRNLISDGEELNALTTETFIKSPRILPSQKI